MLVLRKAFALLLAVAVTACGPQGTYYEKTPDEIAKAIKSAPFPTHVMGGPSLRKKVTQPTPDTVMIALLGKGDHEAIQFVTTITPDGTGARVKTEVNIADDARERIDKGMPNAALKAHSLALLDMMASEHVASAIEGRPFDMTLGTTKASPALANNPDIQRQIAQANQSAAEMAQFEQEIYANGQASGSWAGEDDGGWGADTRAN